MTKFKVLTDRLNTFFTNNKITTGNSIPTSGEWNVGDICISSIQENGECGWICTESGTPGKWEIFGSGGSGKLVSLSSSVQVTEPVTEVSLTGLGTNVSENDKLFVHYNSTHLLEGVDFEIISNGTKIRKLGGGSWNESSSNAMFAFELLKHVKKVNGDNILLDSKMCVLKSNKTISAPVSEVEIGIEGFNKDTDFLTVYVNSTYLTEGVDYNISSDSRKIVSLNGSWNEESLSDYRFSFVVIKEVGIINPEAVVGTENLKDNVVTMTKLGEDVIERLDELSSLNAAKLETARLINGTSFDGTADITTSKWGVGRTLTIGNASKSVNGSENVSWGLAEIGAAPTSHGTHVTYSTTAPAAPGTASAGTASTVARTDHVHPAQTSVSGNAGTATKLQTARTINGVSFDGTQNITIPVTSHNHDSNYLKTNGDSGFCGNLLIDTSSTESKFKSSAGGGLFFNNTRIGMYDWTKQRDIFTFNYGTSELTLGSGTVSTKVNGTFYGMNNIALTRGDLWLSATNTNTTCDYLRFGTNIIASNDNKRMFLIDTAGARANVDMGDVSVYSLLLTNSSYPSIKFSNNVRIEYDAANDALYAAGTKSSSSGFREFRATQCNSTNNAIIAGKKLFIQSGAPSGVSAGDVWIQV